jgi:hypothetical protein
MSSTVLCSSDVGQVRTEKRPGRQGYLASVQPPGADPPWRSGQHSAVCHFEIWIVGAAAGSGAGKQTSPTVAQANAVA